jgi:hypothetical protein
MALYSDTGATYEEVFEVLPKLVPEDAIKNVRLLGGHGDGSSTEGQLEKRSPVLFDVVRSIVEHWPQPPNPIQGRSLADILKESTVRLDSVVTPTPIPTLDRRSVVMRLLGYEQLLHAGVVPWRRTVRAGDRVHVYMDVSGSMEAVKKPLYGAVLDCREYVHPTVHLFSTKISDISLDELRRGVCRTTGGTDIACVAEHMSANRVRRALIVTDGWVGVPSGKHRTTLADAKLAVANDLKAVANFTTILSIGVQQ